MDIPLIKCEYEKMMDVDLIIEHPKNSNNHPDRQIELLAKILNYQGWRQPLILSKRSGLLVSGHGRLLAAKRLGLKEVPVSTQDFENEAQEIAHLIADNKISALAQHDDAKMIEELKLIDLDDFELLGMDNFTLPTEVDPAKEEIEDDIPENVETRCKEGDLWILGEHRLLCGDSTNIQHVERLMGGEKADMVFTDPPYGIEYKSNWSKKFDQLENDNKILDIRPCIEAARENVCAIYVWTSHQVYHKWREMFDDIYKSTIIWYKKFGGMGDLKAEYGHNYEICIYSTTDRIKFKSDRPKAVWEIGSDNPDKYKHPTQKPVALAENAISHHSCNRVLDLFGGSGSTLIACEKTNRKCYMMELDPHYCDVILSRWEKYSGKEAKLCQ